MRRETEAGFQKLVTDYAELMGWWPWHDHDSRRNKAGLPDLLLIRERVVWCELKTETGKVRPEQLATIERLRAAGAEVYLWRPSDWPEIQRVLARV